MVRTVLEGCTPLPSAPQAADRELHSPIIRLDDGLVLDDRVLSSPTMILGPTGSGKSTFFEKIVQAVCGEVRNHGDNAVIFCPKPDYLKYCGPQDIIISPDRAEDPRGCWNIMLEVARSSNTEATARTIAKGLTKQQQSPLQPFFETACNEVLYRSIMALHEDGTAKGIQYSNRDLVDFLNSVSVHEDTENLSWADLEHTRPKWFSHITDYLGESAGEMAYGVAAEIRALLHNAFWGSFNACGTFSAIETLKTGGHAIYLYYDYTTAESTITIFRTILDLLLRQSIDQKNTHKTWFLIDEFSLIPKTCLVDALSLGRSSGFRCAICMQSVSLMSRHHTESESTSLVSLFPNIIAMRVQDAQTRRVISSRYGECLCAYSFTAGIKNISHVEHRPVVADADFATLQRPGDAICSIPSLSTQPFYYHGYREELNV